MKRLNTKKVVFLILLFLAINQVFLSNVFSQKGNVYLSAAKKTANWLSSLEYEESNCDGLSWPYSDVELDDRTQGLCNGAAGIGLFFMKLFKTTGDSIYLQKSIKAGNYIYNESKYVYMPGPDWFSGAAGGGDYFIKLYEITNENAHLEKAEFFAEWLIENKYVFGGGYYWKHSPDFPKTYTGIAHGAAGIGMFFLNLYEYTNNYVHLEHAEKAFDWMKYYSVNIDPNSIGWKRLTDDKIENNLWCGGSTGIIFFLEKLYKVTGKQIYKDWRN